MYGFGTSPPGLSGYDINHNEPERGPLTEREWAHFFNGIKPKALKKLQAKADNDDILFGVLTRRKDSLDGISNDEDTASAKKNESISSKGTAPVNEKAYEKERLKTLCKKMLEDLCVIYRHSKDPLVLKALVWGKSLRQGSFDGRERRREQII